MFFEVRILTLNEKQQRVLNRENTLFILVSRKIFLLMLYYIYIFKYIFLLELMNHKSQIRMCVNFQENPLGGIVSKFYFKILPRQTNETS